MIDIESMEPFISKKIIPSMEAEKLVSDLKKKEKKVGLCNGGFDLLHPGHIKHFESAKSLCDVLFVSVTSDKFVSERKGSGRPIFNDTLRAFSIASLEFVDYVFISNFRRSTEAIYQLKPSFYIKGPDFVRKTTPGIVAERKAIEEVGGEIKYTSDITLSTTKIIKYIIENVRNDKVLLIIDRDGTLIEDTKFLGKDGNWKKNIQLNRNVVGVLSFVQTKLNPVNMVITNQAGVARGYFSCKRVEDINSYLNSLLEENHIKINNWQYCPDVDEEYAKKKTEIKFKKEFIKKKTKRKPHVDMVLDGLKELNMKLNHFNKVVVLGDRHEDEELAKKLDARYIDVKEKNYDELVREFESKMKNN